MKHRFGEGIYTNGIPGATIHLRSRLLVLHNYTANQHTPTDTIISQLAPVKSKASVHRRDVRKRCARKKSELENVTLLQNNYSKKIVRPKKYLQTENANNLNKRNE